MAIQTWTSEALDLGCPSRCQEDAMLSSVIRFLIISLLLSPTNFFYISLIQQNVKYNSFVFNLTLSPFHEIEFTTCMYHLSENEAAYWIMRHYSKLHLFLYDIGTNGYLIIANKGVSGNVVIFQLISISIMIWLN